MEWRWRVVCSPRTVLDAHGLQSIKPLAFATSATAALVSPLIFGAMADRTSRRSGCCAGSPWRRRGPWPWLARPFTEAPVHGPCWRWIQLHALWLGTDVEPFQIPLCLERLKDSQRQFGPIRAVATLGWMAGCWLVSALHADTSALACFIGAGVWLTVAAFTDGCPARPR